MLPPFDNKLGNILTNVGNKNENIPFPSCSAKVISLLDILLSFIFFKLSFIF